MRRPLFLIFVLSAAAAAQVQCYTVTPAGSGTGNGSNWSNTLALSTVNGSTTLTRPAIYYFAGGSYPQGSGTYSLVFKTPVSGTNVIDFRAATAADHGNSAARCSNSATIVTGWNEATMAVDGGAGQAVLAQTTWVSTLQIQTGYFGLYGNPATHSGKGGSCSGTECGFLFDNHTVTTGQSFYWGIDISAGISHVTIDSVEYYGCRSACGSTGETGIFVHGDIGSAITSVSIARNNLHDSNQSYFQTRAASGWAITHNLLARNYSSATAPAVHGNCWDTGGDSDQTFADNWVEDIWGTSCIDDLNAGTPTTSTGWKVYGNIFAYTDNASTEGAGAGVWGCINGNTCSGVFYQNTVYNWYGTVSTYSGVDWSEATAGTVEVSNNMFYGSAASAAVRCAAGATCDWDYNYFGGATTTITHTAETHQQAATGSPFVSAGSDFHLSTNTDVGTSLGSPYNVDLDGVTRTTWSRGTYEYTGAGNPASRTIGGARTIGGGHQIH